VNRFLRNCTANEHAPVRAQIFAVPLPGRAEKSGIAFGQQYCLQFFGVPARIRVFALAPSYETIPGAGAPHPPALT
jgi:hypothetical protein